MMLLLEFDSEKTIVKEEVMEAIDGKTFHLLLVANFIIFLILTQFQGILLKKKSNKYFESVSEYKFLRIKQALK